MCCSSRWPAVGPLAVGAILTGMGRDGARGLKLMRDAGRLYGGAESQSSALVYGMPRVAFEEGAVVEQAPVEAVAGRLAAALNAAQDPQHNARVPIEGFGNGFS
jgi:two-component system chemotaxis response regulator CheB